MPDEVVSKEFFPGIQALRAVAATAVVVQHSIVLVHMTFGADYTTILKMNFGLVGVLVFFCISGFVIGTNWQMPTGEFIGRRFLRIYPAYWVAIAIMLLLTPNDLLGNPIAVGKKTFLLIPSDALPAFNIPFWTLIYEVFFYAVAAFVFWLRLSRDGLTMIFAGWMLIIQLVSVYANVLNPLQPGIWIPFSAYTQFFAVGLIAALNLDRLTRAGPMVFVLVALLLLTIAQLLTPVSLVANSLFTAMAMTAIIVALTAIKRVPRFVLTWGDASYGIYLIHWIAIALVIQFAKANGMSLTSTIVAAIIAALATGLVFGVAEVRGYKLTVRNVWKRRRKMADA